MGQKFALSTKSRRSDPLRAQTGQYLLLKDQFQNRFSGLSIGYSVVEADIFGLSRIYSQRVEGSQGIDFLVLVKKKKKKKEF